MPMPLEPFNFETIRQRALQGINPALLGPMDFATLQRALSNQYNQAATGLAGLDLEEQNTRSMYEENLARALSDRSAAMNNLQQALANRGLGASGTAVQEMANLGSDWDVRQRQLGFNRDLDLQDIAGRRLGYVNAYNQAMGQTELDIGSQARDYLQGLAEQETQRKLMEQLAAQQSQAATVNAAPPAPAIAPAMRPPAPARNAAPAPRTAASAPARVQPTGLAGMGMNPSQVAAVRALTSTNRGTTVRPTTSTAKRPGVNRAF